MRTDTDIAQPRPGRPRQFEPDDVLQKMRAVFAENGFDGASLDDLAAASGLNRPSLYAAFGDKESLYIQALRQNGGDRLRRAQEILDRREPIEERLGAFYADAIAAFCAKPCSPGCMVVGTAIAAAPTRPAIGAAARALRADMQTLLERAFARCLDQKDLPADPPPATRAELAVAILDSISVRARLGEAAESLGAFAQDAIALVCKI
jgi:TetR/AcrR family transcriptional regulator, copper-responsive repressor